MTIWTQMQIAWRWSVYLLNVASYSQFRALALTQQIMSSLEHPLPGDTCWAFWIRSDLYVPASFEQVWEGIWMRLSHGQRWSRAQRWNWDVRARKGMRERNDLLQVWHLGWPARWSRSGQHLPGPLLHL